MNPYREDWFAMGYHDAYNWNHWWWGADDLDTEDLATYTDGWNAGQGEREADW